jgi:hypothetical protein
VPRNVALAAFVVVVVVVVGDVVVVSHLILEPCLYFPRSRSTDIKKRSSLCVGLSVWAVFVGCLVFILSCCLSCLAFVMLWLVFWLPRGLCCDDLAFVMVLFSYGVKSEPRTYHGPFFVPYP